MNRGTMMHHQPLLKDQPIASTGCSIPSRYQTFILDNSDRKGFNSGTRRFQNIDITDTPGPGHYNQTTQIVPKSFNAGRRKKKAAEKSYSEIVARNTGSGLTNRFQTPGPNNYNVSKPMSMRKDHHRANSSSFQSVRRYGKNFCTPAPNAYQPKNLETQATISSCFKSTSKRAEDVQNKPNQRVPSPTHYLLRDRVTKSNDRAPTSCFVSTTNRTEISHKTAKGAFYTDTNATVNSNPGPGSYGNISKWVNRESDDPRAMRRGHYLAISAPAIPLPPSKSLPGPGQYELVDYYGPKHARSSSMFSSNTDRWCDEQRSSYIAKGLPGPASYNPKGVAKQSFIFNADRRWIN